MLIWFEKLRLQKVIDSSLVIMPEIQDGMLKDLGSTNGTVVNDHEIEKQARIPLRVCEISVERTHLRKQTKQNKNKNKTTSIFLTNDFLVATSRRNCH